MTHIWLHSHTAHMIRILVDPWVSFPKQCAHTNRASQTGVKASAWSIHFISKDGWKIWSGDWNFHRFSHETRRAFPVNWIQQIHWSIAWFLSTSFPKKNKKDPQFSSVCFHSWSVFFHSRPIFFPDLIHPNPAARRSPERSWPFAAQLEQLGYKDGAHGVVNVRYTLGCR